MSDHVFEKKDVLQRLEDCVGKKFEDIDNKGIFDYVQKYNLQKGIAGEVVEKCIFEYEADTKQEADLIIIDGEETIKTELKTTGMIIESKPKNHYIAKEPMSITAVGVYDIAKQDFYSSHFWEKLEHLLIIYYHYKSMQSVTPFEYKNFPIVGYEFHEFSEDDIRVLKNDWEIVRNLCKEITERFPGPRNKEWKAAVKEEYINVHGQLRQVLSYINLAPKFPPRFRLKKPLVNTIIANHFGYNLENIPGQYIAVSDIDKRCHELTLKYGGRSISSLASELGVPYSREHENKAISEQIIVAMFGGKSKKLNQISLFEKFGLIGKSVVITPKGGRTEDMKLFKIDFTEITQSEISDDFERREYRFEDSDLYTYFSEHEFLCIVFEEAESKIVETPSGMFVKIPHKLGDNKFIGFKRLVFSDAFIDEKVRTVWEDTRNKILNGTLIDVVQRRKDGSVIINKNGQIKSAPNFIKSKENDVFIRGSGKDSSHKTEYINGIKMLPQYVWIKGVSIIEELNKVV